MNRYFTSFLLFFCLQLVPVLGQNTSLPVKQYDRAVSQTWNQQFLNIERYAAGFRPGPAPRALAYLGLSAYEACITGMSGYRSVAGLFPGLIVPQAQAGLEYHWPTVINASYGYLMPRFFSSMPTTYLDQIAQQKLAFNTTFQAQVNAAVYQRSVALGEAVAAAVWAFAVSDVVGHNAQLDPFGSYDWQANANDPGDWRPTMPGPGKAMFPYWGQVRTFAINQADKLCAPPLPYSEVPGSAFRIQAQEVYDRTINLTATDKWIAEFWSDDLLGLTYSPAPRWISIANQVMTLENSNLETALYCYAKMGLALNDASVACWHSKYAYNIMRPESYIKSVIAPTWEPPLNNPITGETGISPSFPAFPSGHSTFGAAAAKVLADLFGQNYAMTDRSHEGRTDFVGTPRAFTSFYKMAEENAESRMPLGVHYRMDCDEGLVLGYRCGDKVNALPWKTPDCANISIVGGVGSINISNLTAPITIIQVFNSAWAQVSNCAGNCPSPNQTIGSLPAGQYFVKVDFLTANWQPICKKEQFVTVSGVVNTGVLTFNAPNNMSVTAAPGSTTAPVVFAVPTATTTCPGGIVTVVQAAGGASGSNFPIGTSSLVFRASDNCGNSKTVSFNVTVNAGSTGPDCNTLSITGGQGSIAITNLNAPISIVQVFNSAWVPVYNCAGNCAAPNMTIPNLPAGQYFVKVDFLTANWQPICKKEQFASVTGGTNQTDCNNITIVAGSNSLVVGGLMAPISLVQVFNSAWQLVYKCAGNCQSPSTSIPDLPAGRYFVKVDFLTANWSPLCNKEQYVNIGSNLIANGRALADLPNVAKTSWTEVKDFTLFPNPTAGNTFVALHGYEGKRLVLSVSNALGQPVVQQEINVQNDNPVEINTAGLPPGAYIVSLRVLGERLRATRLVVGEK